MCVLRGRSGDDPSAEAELSGSEVTLSRELETQPAETQGSEVALSQELETAIPFSNKATAPEQPEDDDPEL